MLRKTELAILALSVQFLQATTVGLIKGGHHAYAVRAVPLAASLFLSALGSSAVLGMAPMPEGETSAGCISADQASPPSQVTANHDVDIYDNPIEPRQVIGMMEGDSSAPFLERHPHGWCKLDKLKLFDGTTGPGWIAEDHLKMSGAPKANEALQRCTKLCESECLGMPDMPWDECVKQCLVGTRC
jgi:hypothetical protein